jgi:hypothetical protein
MAGIPLNPKLVHHHALAAVDRPPAGNPTGDAVPTGAAAPTGTAAPKATKCVFEHAVIGHQMQADGHLKAIQDRLKAHCGL